MMKALTLTLADTGPPVRKVIELSKPPTGRGEILVRIHYAALNYIDLELTKGQHNIGLARALKRYPVVSGIEMAGIAESDGTKIKKGDRVFGYTNIFKGPFYHSQFVATPEKNLALVPENTSLEGATSIIGGALTSIKALEHIVRLQQGSEVLITGATGSVGVTGVQLAKYLGAHVSAVCHSAQRDFVLSQGASKAYSYDRQEMPEQENQFDLVFDTAPALSFSAASGYLKKRGRYISTMPHLDIRGALRSLCSRKKWGFLLEYDTDAERMEQLRLHIAKAAFEPVIESIHALSAASDAFHKQLKSGKRGKILIDFRSP